MRPMAKFGRNFAPQSRQTLMLYSLSKDEGHRATKLVVEEPQSLAFLDVRIESCPVRTVHLFEVLVKVFVRATFAKLSPCCTRRHSSVPSPRPRCTTGWWRACRGRPPRCTSCTWAGPPPMTSSSWGRGQSPWRAALSRSALQRGTAARRTFWWKVFHWLFKVWFFGFIVFLVWFSYPHISSRTFLVSQGLYPNHQIK